MPAKALYVGINDYSPTGSGGPDLNGCVNDMADVAWTLHRLGIVQLIKPNVRVLANENATRENIQNGLKWLLKDAKPGDLRVFSYSGHGSYMADVSGDESDGKDETICPHDFATAGMIRDDELGDAFSVLPDGVNLEVIFDSCHSGTATRMLPVASGGNYLADRYVQPPAEDFVFAEAFPGLPTRTRIASPVQEREIKPSRMKHVLWSACRDHQVCQEADIGGTIRGVFTYAFCKELSRTCGTHISRGKLHSRIATRISSMGYSQILQLECAPAMVDERTFT